MEGEWMCMCPMEQRTTGKTREAPDGKATQVSLEKLKLCCTTCFYLTIVTIREILRVTFARIVPSCSNTSRGHRKDLFSSRQGWALLSLPSPALPLLSSKPLNSLGLQMLPRGRSLLFHTLTLSPRLCHLKKEACEQQMNNNCSLD